MLTDTHAHLDYPDFQEDFAGVLARAESAGVRRILTIGTSIEGSRRAVRLAESHPMIWAVVGIHPTDIDDISPNFPDELREIARSPRVVAIGETGLDYHRLPGAAMRGKPEQVAEALLADIPEDAEASIADGAVKAAQAEIFGAQLELAAELGLHVVIHQRDAWRDTLEQIAPYSGKVRAVFHCFGGSPEQAAELAGMGHLVSFTGIVTFKNAGTVRDTVAAVAEDGFMLETDCPYLAPVPHRGERCEPAHTRLVAEKVAELRGTSLEAIAACTERTANAFFRFDR